MAEARFVDTTHERLAALREKHGRTVVLTIAYHADPARIGERATLDRLGMELSRLEPMFAGSEAEPRPLDDPFVSRKPLFLAKQNDGVRVDNPAGHELVVDGVAAGEHTTIANADLARGVTLELSGRVVLLVHDVAKVDRPPSFDMVGVSEALDEVRRTLGRIAAGPAKSVLITAESGSGKELAARAIHEQSERRAGPFVALNVGAFVPTTVASELFGHARGAFTGADEERAGAFERADGGTLLLDEIGEAPLEVQAALLRVLETGEIQRVGGETKTVDVRVVAATDADLEAGVEDGTFRKALLYRLTEAHVQIPPLHERRADVGPLLAHFAEPLVDRTLEPRLWLSTALVGAFVRAPWPGNVRQLRNVCRWLATERVDDEEVGLDEALEKLVGPLSRTKTEAVDGGSLLDVLRRNGFQLNRAAAELGISRSTLDRRIARDPSIRKAKDLNEEEIKEALDGGTDVAGAAARLEVSERGLKLRMAQLGIE